MLGFWRSETRFESDNLNQQPESVLKGIRMALIPVILCGGSGSRLWPVSREHHPKPFIRLEDGQSFLQKALVSNL